METRLYIDKGGNVSGLADDVLDKLVALGEKEVTRVSNIEFNHDIQQWVAVDSAGEIIAVDPVRSQVVEKERKYLNSEIEKSFAAAQ
jgi:hypothetical protein